MMDILVEAASSTVNLKDIAKTLAKTRDEDKEFFGPMQGFAKVERVEPDRYKLYYTDGSEAECDGLDVMSLLTGEIDWSTSTHGGYEVLCYVYISGVAEHTVAIAKNIQDGHVIGFRRTEVEVLEDLMKYV